MTSEMKAVGKWNIPKHLYDEYVKFRSLSDAYVLKKPIVTRNGTMSDAEVRMRWLSCVQRVMELHREICKAINVEYSEESDDEFYRVFHEQTHKDAAFKENKTT